MKKEYIVLKITESKNGITYNIFNGTLKNAADELLNNYEKLTSHNKKNIIKMSAVAVWAVKPENSNDIELLEVLEDNELAFGLGYENKNIAVLTPGEFTIKEYFKNETEVIECGKIGREI